MFFGILVVAALGFLGGVEATREYPQIHDHLKPSTEQVYPAPEEKH
jgi:hypothetical protein